MHLNSKLLGLLLMIYKKAYLQHYKSLPLFEKSRVYIYKYCFEEETILWIMAILELQLKVEIILKDAVLPENWI